MTKVSTLFNSRTALTVDLLALVKENRYADLSQEFSKKSGVDDDNAWLDVALRIPKAESDLIYKIVTGLHSQGLNYTDIIMKALVEKSAYLAIWFVKNHSLSQTQQMSLSEAAIQGKEVCEQLSIWAELKPFLFQDCIVEIEKRFLNLQISPLSRSR